MTGSDDGLLATVLVGSQRPRGDAAARSACWPQSIPLLDQAALVTVMEWVFQPAMKHGS